MIEYYLMCLMIGVLGVVWFFLFRGTPITIYRYDMNRETGEITKKPTKKDRATISKKVAGGFYLMKYKKPLGSGCYGVDTEESGFGMLRKRFYSFTLDDLAFHKAPVHFIKNPNSVGILPEPSGATAFFVNWSNETQAKRMKLERMVYLGSMGIFIAVVGILIIYQKMSHDQFVEIIKTAADAGRSMSGGMGTMGESMSGMTPQ